MTEVKKYRAYDGREFECAEECLAHEKWLDTRNDVGDFVKLISNFCKSKKECKDCPYSDCADTCLFYHTPATWMEYFNV